MDFDGDSVLFERISFEETSYEEKALVSLAQGLYRKGRFEPAGAYQPDVLPVPITRWELPDHDRAIVTAQWDPVGPLSKPIENVLFDPP